MDKTMMIEFEEYTRTLVDAYDPDEVVGVLNLTTEEIVEAFRDRVFDVYKDTMEDISDGESEDGEA